MCVSVDVTKCHACEDKLCVSKLCVSKLYVDKLCVDKFCGRCGGGRREADGGRTDGGIQNQKQEPHTKMWGTKKHKFQQLPRSGPIVPGKFSFFGFCWCLCRFGDSRLCILGSWQYFKLMFQRSKHTILFE